jgi:uncharacterized protein YndB with AHSA1/START domain
MRKNDEPIIVEQTYNASIETIWNSITKIDQMRKWYFTNIPALKPEVGFKTQFNVQSQDRNFIPLWEVIQVEPLKMITYNWKYEGYSGDSFVVFELFHKNNLTKLRLIHQIQESFPEEIPEFSRESYLESWTFFIKKRLKEFLEK